MSKVTFWDLLCTLFSGADSIVSLRKDKSVVIVRGAIPVRLMHDLQDLNKNRECGNGYIYVHGTKSNYYISFSNSVKEAVHQKIRNIWQIYF